MLNFHQSLPFLNWLFPLLHFSQEFPTRFSHKIFPQQFPARFSHKIFPQVFPELDPDWLAPHHPIPNAKFPPITTFLKLVFPLLLFPQDFPARFSHKIFPQQFSARFSSNNFPQQFPTRFSHNNFLQDFPARFSRKIFPSWILIGWLPITLFQMLNFHQSLPFLNWLFFLQQFPRRISHKIFLQDFPATISHKIFPQQFPKTISHKIFLTWIIIGWLPITLFQMLNLHQSLPFLNCFSPLFLFPQDFPARISCKIFPQEFPTRFSNKNFPQNVPTRFSRKIFPQDFPASFSRAGS